MPNNAPNFLSLDGPTIVAEMVADYQARTGRPLYPAQSEMFLINAFAYRELLLRQQIQAVVSQMLVDFATAPGLDYLGALLGVSRLPASAATCILEFTLVAGHGGVVIPSGTRVASTDGRVSFATTQNVDVDAGINTAQIEAFANVLGATGNGYVAGDINNILDPQPYLTAAANLATTSGGADSESDDALRTRIKSAPSQFSNAGSSGAYRFHALTASPAIIDVGVVGPPTTSPGVVNVYPLMADGSTTPAPIIALVEAALNDEKIRPLTDTVNVLSPTVVDFDIEVELTAYTDADTVALQAAVEAALNEYKALKSQRLGQDIVLSQIVGRCLNSGVAGVYDVAVVSPATDLTIADTEVAICGTVTVSVTGTTDG